MESQQQLDESLSWRLITELYRRHPQKFFLIEMHPGDGQYDCLSLRDLESGDGLLDLNRPGSLHLHFPEFLTSSWMDWRDQLLKDPIALLNKLSETLRLPVPKKLPKSTHTCLVYRVITEFLSHAIGGKVDWECRNGFCDSSGWGGGPRTDWFKAFPAIKTLPVPERHPNLEFQTEYYYWFLLRDAEPVLCFDVNGTVITKAGKTLQLMSLYQKHHRIWPMIYTVAGDLLP